MDYFISANTDVGIKKDTNQDGLSVKIIKTPKEKIVFAILCDGMGGLAKGEVASTSVITAFNNWAANSLPNLFRKGISDAEIRSQCNDCLVEVWGFARARTVIWLGFIMNFLFVLFGMIADILPGASYWHGQEAFHSIFGLAPRIALASFTAFLAGSFMNAYVMSRMKIGSGGKFFSVRAIASTIAGESIDSLIFFPLALGGIVPYETLPIMMLSQVFIKTAYEILILPVTIRVVKAAKKYEDLDVYDNNVKYNIFRL